MSEYTARPRPEVGDSNNDLYHLYTGDGTDAVMCRAHVSYATSESHTVTEADLEYSAYLKDDNGDVVGRVCRNCRQIVLGTVFE